MNMQAYEADTAWNRGIPCIFFKILIQLYVLRSFLYSLTYCIKEAIKGEIFWILNEKSVGLWGSYGLKQRNPLQFFQNTNKNLYVLCTNYFTNCIIKGIKIKKFWRWIKKLSALDADFLVWIVKKDSLEIFFW